MSPFQTASRLVSIPFHRPTSSAAATLCPHHTLQWAAVRERGRRDETCTEGGRGGGDEERERGGGGMKQREGGGAGGRGEEGGGRMRREG